MAAPRLPFLWPMLYKSTETLTPKVRSAQAAARIRAYHPSPRRKQQETVSQRYGSANEPPPHLEGGKGLGPRTKQAEMEQPKLPKIGEKLQKDGEQEVKEEKQQAQVEVAKDDKRKEPTTVEGSLARPMQGDPMLYGEPALGKDPPAAPPQPDAKPVESLLDSIPEPVEHKQQQEQEQKQAQGEVAPEEHPDRTFDEHSPPVKAPRIEAPRYMHHFDTYGLVKRLDESGWDDAQAITTMKAVRLMLADNMDLAREALVSKSMVENETYLFRAACAELRTEVMSRRKGEQEKMRTERTHLQHEVDILSQRLGQEMAAMKDDLKGMFDDRKMAVRNEQRCMESNIQQLNYKITVNLQADARSEVEGLRWVMTRRVIMTLFVIVVMVVGSLKLYSNALRDQEAEEKRRANQRSGGTQIGDDWVGSADGRREAEAKALGGGEVLVREGDSVGYVSLG